MSLQKHSITIAVQKFDDLENTLNNFDNITCNIFVNLRPVASLEVTDPQTFIPIVDLSPQDIIQFIFYKHNKNEIFGCISFQVQQFIEANQQSVYQWATLFEDPEDDIFDGRIGEDDQDLPRALIHFKIKTEGKMDCRPITSITSSQHQKNYDDQVQELSDINAPKYDELTQKSHDSSIGFQHNNKTLNAPANTSPDKSHNQLNIGNIEEMQIDLLEIKCPLELERKSSLGSRNHSQSSFEDLVTSTRRNYMNDADECGSLDSTKFNSKTSLHPSKTEIPKGFKNSIKSAFGKEHGNETGNQAKGKQCECDSQSKGGTVLMDQNAFLKNKINEMETVVERLRKENALLSHNEEVYAAKINELRTEVAALKAAKDNYERGINEKDKQLESLEISKREIIKERDHLALLLQQSQKVGNVTKSYSSNNKHEDEERGLHQELSSLRSQIRFDETIIQNLQKELFSLRQMGDNTLELSNKLVATEERARYFEEKILSLMEAFSVFSVDKSCSESIEDFVSDVKNQIDVRMKEIEELKNTNEDLTIRLSICDNKLLADSLLDQIESLKNNVALLEKERENLREELFKANENYMKLTNKFMELSDSVTNLKKSNQNEHQSHSQGTIHKLPLHFNKKPTNTKPSHRSHESVDEIEAKLIEFTVFHKIQPSILTRIDHGVYLYGGKKVFLKVIEGQLVIKVGEEYKPLQEFLQSKNGTKITANSLRALLKDTSKKEQKAPSKLRISASNYSSIQTGEHSQRDLSGVDVGISSRSICKENMRNAVKQICQSGSSVLDSRKNSAKSLTRRDSNLKLKEILTSRVNDRRMTLSSYQRKEKSQRDLTPL